MRSIKLAVTALALAAATLTVPAAAQAAEPEENITLDISLLGCSLSAGLGGELLTAFGTGSTSGSSGKISSGLATRLRLAGCLPWV
ncbi:hypothetical protein [Nocardia sp. XZ_19_385]|uniref:hypothetical protein n=1 Tax=Nocardia sp. XZ_19_385 TaxID=2769488 RepID=UPI00188EAFA1|nr:hypothetical protein [Nocardia sp. XZ_19_385]